MIPQPSGSPAARLSTKDLPVSPSPELLELASVQPEPPENHALNTPPLALVDGPLSDPQSGLQPSLEGSGYTGLPLFLQRILATYSSDHERAIMLSGMLPVLGGLMRNVEIPYRSKIEHVSLYTLVIGPSGSDKGVMGHARAIGEKLDLKLIAGSEADRQSWRLADGKGEEPPFRRFFVAGNSSAAALIQNVAANGGEGVVLESEAMTLTTTHRQDWGDSRDFYLKAHHGERYSLERMDRRVVIEAPRLNMGISGTPKTAKGYIKTLEDGLFSRFLVYYASDKAPFRALRPGKEDRERRRLLDRAGDLALEIYETLHSRQEPLRIDLRDEDWEELEMVFGGWYEHVDGFEELNSCCLRMPLHVVRMATVFALVRAFTEGSGVSNSEEALTVESRDLRTAIGLGERYLNRAFQFAGWMQETRFENAVDPTEQLVSVMPFGRFRTKEAKKIVQEKLGHSVRWTGKHLRRAAERGLLDDLGHGRWERKEDSGSGPEWPVRIPEIG